MEKLIIFDGINNNIESANSFEDFKEYVDECNDEKEGIHPDIEMIELYQRVGYVDVTELTGQFKPNEKGEQVQLCKVKCINLLRPSPDSESGEQAAINYASKKNTGGYNIEVCKDDFLAGYNYSQSQSAALLQRNKEMVELLTEIRAEVKYMNASGETYFGNLLKLTDRFEELIKKNENA